MTVIELVNALLGTRNGEVSFDVDGRFARITHISHQNGRVVVVLTTKEEELASA